MRSRIMYIEDKSESLNGRARIGWVYYSKTGATLYYGEKSFRSIKGGYKANYFEIESGDEYWISGPKKNGTDRLYASNIPIEIDDNARVEYWTTIRKMPQNRRRTTA